MMIHIKIIEKILTKKRKMTKKYYFVYITTNLITGKQYVGDHSCDNLEKDNEYIGHLKFFSSKKTIGKIYNLI